MNRTELEALYRDYIDCLNRQDWHGLARFVDEAAARNGQHLGLAGYRAMLAKDYIDIPDLRFDIDLLLADPPNIAARLRFDCHPKGNFLGLAVNGRRVVFTENVFYEFRNGRIVTVWSLLDRDAIAAQIGMTS